MISGCPGAKRFRQPTPETVRCPHCGSELELWTDEIKTACPKCTKEVLRTGGQSCLDWCRYAKECVGDQLYKKFMLQKSITVKEKLIKRLEEHFGDDQKRIEHAKNVMSFAEELLKVESGDWHIVIPASILHDVGIRDAERRSGPAETSSQEKEGARIARTILLELGFKMGDIDEICEIIAHHHTPGVVNTLNFRILFDADNLVNLEKKAGPMGRESMRETIEKTFLTEAGEAIAVRKYVTIPPDLRSESKRRD